jgi:hypothetical protein
VGELSELSTTLKRRTAFKLAGELYSGAFYRELYRILKRGGRFFHYIGDPDSKARGGITRGAMHVPRQSYWPQNGPFDINLASHFADNTCLIGKSTTQKTPQSTDRVQLLLMSNSMHSGFVYWS